MWIDLPRLHALTVPAGEHENRVCAELDVLEDVSVDVGNGYCRRGRLQSETEPKKLGRMSEVGARVDQKGAISRDTQISRGSVALKPGQFERRQVQPCHGSLPLIFEGYVQALAVWAPDIRSNRAIGSFKEVSRLPGPAVVEEEASLIGLLSRPQRSAIGDVTPVRRIERGGVARLVGGDSFGCAATYRDREEIAITCQC